MTYTSDVIDVINSGVPTTNTVDWVDSGIGTYNILKNTLSNEDFLTALESKYTNRFTKTSFNPLQYNPKAWYRSDGCHQDAATQFTAADKSWLQIADASQTGLDPGTNDFLWMAWVKNDTLSNYGTILGKLTVGTLYARNTGMYQFDFASGAYAASVFSAAGSCVTGTWTHVAVYADRSGNLQLYVNGVASGSAVDISGAAAQNLNTAYNFCIGGLWASASSTLYHYDGSVDSVMIFSAANLSTVAADIIAWAYNSGSGRLASDITAAQKTAWGAVSAWDLGEACYDDQTEVMTENGWKFFKDVEKSEKVATLDDIGVMTYAESIEYHEYDHDGTMFHQKSRSIDVMVTPNHTMYVRRASQIPADKSDTTSGFERIQAKDMPKCVAYKRDMKWKGEERDFFVLPEFRKMYTCTKNQQKARRANATKLCNDKWGRDDSVVVDAAEPATYERVWEERRIPMDVWLRFFGVWLAEGWTSTTPNKYRIGVSQSAEANPSNYAEIEEILKDLGYNYCKDDKGFEIVDIQLHSYLSKFGKSHEKFIPKEIKHLSPRQLRVLYSGMHIGDGWDKPNGYGYGTCSKQLADDVQEIAAKMGMAATLLHIPYDRQAKIVCGRPRKSGYDFYSLSITRKSLVREVNVGGADMRSWPHYTGKVYCLTVPNGLLYVRRNGCVCWCGNSGTRYDSWGSNHLSQAFAELTTNGTFTGNATGWSLGANWAYGTDNIAATAADADVTQALTATVGKLYSTSFALGGTPTGSVRLEFGGVNLATRSTAATHAETIRATATGTNLAISPVATFTGTIDTVSVKAAEILPAPGIVRGQAQDSNFAASLNGTSQYFSYTGTVFDPGIGDFSVGCAFYLAGLPASGSLATLFSSGAAQSGSKHFWVYVNSGGGLSVKIGDVDGLATLNWSGMIVVGNWYTLVASFDRDGNLTLTVNGTAENAGSIAAQEKAIDPGGLSLGRYQTLANYFLSGYIDNAFYANCLLTADEIAFLHNNGEWRQWAELGVAGTKGENLTSSVIKGFWEFDDASDIGKDSTDAGNDLMPQGSPTRTNGINYLEGIVSYIEDQSSNIYNLTKSTLAGRPSFISNAINGHGIIRFDGIDDYFDSGLAGLANTTIFYVGKMTTAETYPVGVIDTNNRSYITSNASNLFGGGIANDAYDTIITDELATSYFIGILDNNGTIVHLYFNGGLEYEATQDGVISTSENYYIGALNNAGTPASYFAGDIAEIIIFDSVLARVYRRNILKYLSKRYNISISYS